MSGGKALSRFHQPISVPGRRLFNGVGLNFVKSRALGGGGKSVNHEIPLIPFIDFLLCIVLFLLASFSATGELPVDPSIKLPSAENVDDMAEAPLVAISGTQIMVNGTPAGSVRAIEDANRLQRVEELFDVLKAQRETWTQVQPTKPFPGVVILQVDHRVKALVVKSVFQTAAYAGYPNVSFMVRRRGGSEGEG